MEEVLVSYWQSLTFANSADATIVEKRIDIAIRYAEFLRLQKRFEEAENILRGTWLETEHAHKDSSNPAIIKCKKKIGDGLQGLGAAAAAQAVFASLWAYYARSSNQSSSDAIAVSQSLADTSKDMNTNVTTHEVSVLVASCECVNEALHIHILSFHLSPPSVPAH